MKRKSYFLKPWPKTIFLLLTLCSLSFLATCRIHTFPEQVPIGEAKIVGKILEGGITWEPGEPKDAQYFIVTKAFTARFYATLWENRLQAEEIKKLRALLEKKGNQ